MLLIQDFLHGQELDDSAGSLCGRRRTPARCRVYLKDTKKPRCLPPSPSRSMTASKASISGRPSSQSTSGVTIAGTMGMGLFVFYHELKWAFGPTATRGEED